MLVKMETGGSGDSGAEMEICGYKYIPAYYCSILNTSSGTITTGNIPVSGSGSVVGTLMKVENGGSQTLTWTALNGAYLYRLGSNNTGGIESLGKNGTYSQSGAYQANVTIIATKEPLNV
jgi:hypothetical protein